MYGNCDFCTCGVAAGRCFTFLTMFQWNPVIFSVTFTLEGPGGSVHRVVKQAKCCSKGREGPRSCPKSMQPSPFLSVGKQERCSGGQSLSSAVILIPRPGGGDGTLLSPACPLHRGSPGPSITSLPPVALGDFGLQNHFPWPFVYKLHTWASFCCQCGCSTV